MKRCPRCKTTTITLTADELSALVHYVSAGMVLLQTDHPVRARLKSALTRLDLPRPAGW